MRDWEERAKVFAICKHVELPTFHKVLDGEVGG